MDHRNVMATLVLTACLAAPAASQDRPAAHRDGSWELSLGTGATFVDASLRGFLGSGAPEYRFANGPTLGSAVSVLMFRLGYNVSRRVGLSVASGVAGGDGVSYLTPSVALTFTPNLNARTSPFLLVGTEFTRISGNHDRVTHSVWGAHAGLGLRSRITDALALRLEGLLQMEGYREVPMTKRTVLNPTITLGLSYFIGGRAGGQ